MTTLPCSGCKHLRTSPKIKDGKGTIRAGCLKYNDSPRTSWTRNVYRLGVCIAEDGYEPSNIVNDVATRKKKMWDSGDHKTIGCKIK